MTRAPVDCTAQAGFVPRRSTGTTARSTPRECHQGFKLTIRIRTVVQYAGPPLRSSALRRRVAQRDAAGRMHAFLYRDPLAEHVGKLRPSPSAMRATCCGLRLLHDRSMSPMPDNPRRSPAARQSPAEVDRLSQPRAPARPHAVAELLAGGDAQRSRAHSSARRPTGRRSHRRQVDAEARTAYRLFEARAEYWSAQASVTPAGRSTAMSAANDVPTARDRRLRQRVGEHLRHQRAAVALDALEQLMTGVPAQGALATGSSARACAVPAVASSMKSALRAASDMSCVASMQSGSTVPFRNTGLRGRG